MNVRNWLRKLERETQGNMIAIPQADGSTKRFPPTALSAALLNSTATLRARTLGEEPPAEHALITACRNSSEPKWSESLYSGVEAVEPVEDLSE
jgi:hypothetical protein